MPLHVEQRGDGAGGGPPLVLLHGFTQTGRLWGRFGELMAQRHHLVAVDLPGHGDSNAVTADLPDTAALVADAVTTAIGTAPFDLLGYSLGARVALHMLLGPELALRRAVLIGATGGIEDPAARQSRRRADDTVAAALEASGDVDAFIARWLAGPLFARLPADAADAAERRRNTAPGLAASLRSAGTGTQDPLWDRLATVATPMFALAGTDDVRFSAHALRLARLARAPVAAASLIPAGGHAVHLAQPDATARLVGHWLDAP